LMMADGVDITKPFTSDQFNKGIETLQRQIDSGQIRAVNGGDYTESLKSGDALAAIAWSGDITSLNYELEDEAFGFALPESGGTLWADNSMIPIGSPHKSNAEKLIDYYLDPKVAAELAAWVTYICPVKGAKEEMEKIDDTLVDNDLIFPSEEYLKNAKVFRTLSDAEELEFSTAYQKLAGN
ncbi:MAG: extracellular solute-binding protein, partial [Angustibacter sp.]